jgi:hypothetical protein
MAALDRPGIDLAVRLAIPTSRPENGMLDQKMSGVIIFVFSGLFVYWLSRTITLLHGSETEIDEMLAHDLWLCRKILLLVRSAFPPPTQFVG